MNNLSMNEKYLVDKEGHRVGVFLTMQEYRSLMNRLEELESFKAAREEINIVDQLLAEANKEGDGDNLPTFKRRQGPGGMVVI
jgi:PHD/YefM family antitoxin component YafN of YafNO toxin-antitoxin module